MLIIKLPLTHPSSSSAVHPRDLCPVPKGSSLLWPEASVVPLLYFSFQTLSFPLTSALDNRQGQP